LLKHPCGLRQRGELHPRTTRPTTTAFACEAEEENNVCLEHCSQFQLPFVSVGFSIVDRRLVP